MNTNSTAALSYDNMNDAHPLYVRSPSGRYRPATDDQILAAGRVAAESLIATDDAMSQPGRVAKFFQSKLSGLGHECAAFLYLDSQLKPIRYIEQATGTLSHASIYPREIVKTALRLNAAALVMAHNHPSGIAEPSPADINMTRQLKQALALIDVRVLDHIIVAATDTTSLAERGQV
ncbi:JAB domain-containing protein [Castellaniella sp. S9]|uniref:JAB domain-containing protein n=1 Tax=Castellaniella sp. S9 TaxID=2993652 RepID=UPI0022B39AF8|nr:JAB domain-containing protein [Castellaniella sp. S9]